MFISLERSSAVGFRKWSDSQKPDRNDNDDPNRGNTAVMTALARLSPVLKRAEDSHRPWLVPGAGTSF
jgi:hypothetical protein